MLMGIDVGTTGVKVSVYDYGGICRGFGKEAYPILFPAGGFAEQDAPTVWEKIKNAIKTAVDISGGTIAAISVSVQGDAAMLIDRQGNPLTNVQLGMDYRGAAELEKLTGHFGVQTLYKQTGIPPSPLCTLPKLMWFQTHCRAQWESCYKAVTYAEYVLLKLGCREAVIDRSMASRTLACSLAAGEWEEEILSFCGIPAEKLSCIVDAGEAVGALLPSLAAELGIHGKAVLVAGGHDQTCAALGAGLVEAGTALDSHGTAEVLSTVLDTPLTNDLLQQQGCPTYRHVVPEKYFSFGLNHFAGVVFQWFQAQLCAGISYESILAAMPAEPSRVLMLSHFQQGGGLFEKGVFAGVDLSTTREEMGKAVLESLAFEMKNFLCGYRKAGLPINRLLCVGGGAGSDLGLQLKADVYGIPVTRPENREAAGAGAAILAGCGIGIYDSCAQAVPLFCRKGTEFTPNPLRSREYDMRFEEYEGLKQLWKQEAQRV